MSVTAFGHGVVLAVGLIVALGPQNVFVFQQGAVQPRFRRAVPTVVTAGLCDTLLVGLAVLGVSLVVLRVPWLETALFGAGFGFLLYVGWRLYAADSTLDAPDAGSYLAPREQVAFTASVSLLNPHAVLDTVGVIGTSALAYDTPARWAFTLGCLVVSWAWFAGLAVAGWRVGEAADADRWLRWFDVVAAAAVWVVALYMGWQFLVRLS
jgi:L-lysine exporter family protein LysE/ArgO